MQNPRDIVLALTILQQMYVDINSPGTPFLPGNYVTIGSQLQGICRRIVAIPSGADADLMMLTWKIAWKLEHARSESINQVPVFDAYLSQNSENHLGFSFGTILKSDPVVSRRYNHAALAYETLIWEPENIALFNGVYDHITFLNLNQLVKSFIFPLDVDP